jgi:iron complex outermembrane receptor protein
MKHAFSCISLALLVAGGSVARADDDSAPPKSPPSSVPTTTVYGSKADENYRVEATDSVGPLGSVPLVNVPYSVSVLPHAVIENSQAVNFKDVSKYMPLVAYQEQQGPDILRPQTRGMQGGNFQNSRMDGMTMFITVATALEQFEQIEVVNGLSASLYGPANPSGMFNFVSKRPTEDDYREATVTYQSNSIGTGALDVSGRFDKNGIVKYRFNGVFGGGGGYTDGSHQKRELGDLGIDVRPWDDTVLELNYSMYRLTNTGYPGWFSYSEAVQLPSAPNPKLVGYDQEYLGVDLKTQMSEARIKHDFGADWHLVAGILNQDGTRNIDTQVNNLTNNTSHYTSSMGATFAPRFVITSDTAYLDGSFDTFGLKHDVTIGTAGYRSSSYALTTPRTAAGLLLGAATVGTPLQYPYPTLGVPNANANYDSSDVYQQGVNFSDTVFFDEYVGARIGVSQDWFHTNNFNNKGIRTTEYADHGVSPTGSLLFKPAVNQTAYFTYASSLQAGDLAPAGTLNQGQGLAPYRSKEYEVGYKATLAKVDFTAAVFRIERPFANTVGPVGAQIFEISGDQVNKGVELSAIGEIYPGLTLYGGVTLLNARLEDTPTLATNDKYYVGAPKVKGNTLFEYKIPTVEGLVAVFNYQFSGPRYGNDSNTLQVAGYNLFDVGARYSHDVLGMPLTLRLTVDNVADRHYWSTIGPSNLTGANTGSLLAHFGSPRTVLAGASVNF